jgi:hypothetical protein
MTILAGIIGLILGFYYRVFTTTVFVDYDNTIHSHPVELGINFVLFLLR